MLQFDKNDNFILLSFALVLELIQEFLQFQQTKTSEEKLAFRAQPPTGAKNIFE